jgi:hypothetical protein
MQTRSALQNASIGSLSLIDLPHMAMMRVPSKRKELFSMLKSTVFDAAVGITPSILHGNVQAAMKIAVPR